MSKLIKSNNGIWELSNLKGLDLEGLCSVLDQVLTEPGCPERILLTDINETYRSIDLQNKQARQLLWEKL